MAAKKKLDVDLEKLLEAGAHFGHQIRRWNPKMAPFMYKVQDGIFVFDLIKTRDILVEVLDVLKEASSKKKVILFVGTKKQARQKVREVAEECGCPYVTERWLGGTFTNFNEIQKSIMKLNDMKKKMQEGDYKSYTKKERLLISRKIERMERFFGGILDLDKLPDMIVIVDTHREKTAVQEARRVKVPIIGIVDSNADPTLVDWSIPMNDDATSAVEYVLELMKEAIIKGKSSR